MRAIIHLVFRGDYSNRLFHPACFIHERIRPTLVDQRLGSCAIRHHAGNSLSKFPSTRINRLQTSQNAAALLFDFEIVDIRRVGTR
jgi:hypothetical protein